jgi:hypothetical protein
VVQAKSLNRGYETTRKIELFQITFIRGRSNTPHGHIAVTELQSSSVFKMFAKENHDPRLAMV